MTTPVSLLPFNKMPTKMTAEPPVSTVRWIGFPVVCCVVGFVAVLLVGFACAQDLPQLRISPETTHITEPLTPDGLFVDYFAAVEQRAYPPTVLFGRSTGIATDDNGYRVVFRALGDCFNETNDPALLQQRYEKLGLDVNRDTPTLSFVEPQDFLQKRISSHPEDFDLITADRDDEPRSRFRLDVTKVMEHPDFHKLPIVQTWLEENNAALDLIVEASKKPVFVAPYIRRDGTSPLISVHLPGMFEIRSFVRGLAARANIRIREGDIDGAIDDVLACYRFSRHIEKQPMLVEGLVGVAIEDIAHGIPYHLSEIRANAEQLKRLQNELAALSVKKGFVPRLEFERFMCLDAMTSTMKGMPVTELANGLGGDHRLETRMVTRGIDWNLVFKKVNDVYDELEKGTFVYTEPSQNPLRYLTVAGRSNALADIFIALFLPATEAANEAWHRIDCTMNLKRIVLAMHLYEREHGTLPPAFSVDADGKPLHSWRTLLLPYFGDEELATVYAQIKLDEAWDSEHNRQFHGYNLDVYRCPSNTLLDGDASYAVIVGDGLLFTADGRGQTLAGHGRNMLMVVEHQESVCWMRPDAEITKAQADLGIGSRRNPAPVNSNHTGGCNFGRLDGEATYISETITADVFTELIRGTTKVIP